MPLPTSGQLSLNDIKAELGAASTDVSLCTMSKTAIFVNPDLISDFYGYSYAGYMLGGGTGALINSIKKLSFSLGTWSTLAATLAIARDIAFGNVSSAVNGYIGGGRTNLTTAITNDIEKFVFSTEAMSAFATNLPTCKWFHTGYGDVTAYGYWSAGNSSTDSTSYTLTTHMITYSSEAVAANTSANVAPARRYETTVNNPSSAAYIGGGSTNAFVSCVDKITYSTQTRSANTNKLSQVSGYRNPLSDGTTYGYFSGGWTGAGGTLTTLTDMVTFSTDGIAANTASNLTLAKRYSQGLSDGTTYGYMSGGYTTTYELKSDKMTFSLGTYAADTTSNLAIATQQSSTASSNGL